MVHNSFSHKIATSSNRSTRHKADGTTGTSTSYTLSLTPAHPPTRPRGIVHSFGSGDVGTPSWIDGLLGRPSAYWRFSFMDCISDHSASEYINHFKKMVLDSRVLVLKKAKSFAKDTATQVIYLF